MLDPRKVAESRKTERESATFEGRQVLALEHIADALECIRADQVGFQQAVMTLLQSIAQKR